MNYLVGVCAVEESRRVLDVLALEEVNHVLQT